jgi:hypothetical protein
LAWGAQAPPSHSVAPPLAMLKIVRTVTMARVRPRELREYLCGLMAVGGIVGVGAVWSAIYSFVVDVER